MNYYHLKFPGENIFAHKQQSLRFASPAVRFSALNGSVGFAHATLVRHRMGQLKADATDARDQ